MSQPRVISSALTPLLKVAFPTFIVEETIRFTLSYAREPSRFADMPVYGVALWIAFATWLFWTSVGLKRVALTDSALSPLAGASDSSMVLRAGGVGPFDSHVGTLALLNVLVAGVSDVLRDVAADRLDRAEAAWSAESLLIDR